MAEIERIQPPGMAVRRIEGRVLYSHVVSATGARSIYVSGQLARNEAGEIVGVGDMGAQIEQVAANLRKCLEAAGATMADVVKTTTYVTDIDLFFQFTAQRARIFGESPATSTTVEVRRLSHPDFMVEIEAVAML